MGSYRCNVEKLREKTSALYPLHLLFRVRDLFPATHLNIVPDCQPQIWMAWLLFNKVVTLGGAFLPILIFLFLIRKQLFFKAKAWQGEDGA